MPWYDSFMFEVPHPVRLSLEALCRQHGVEDDPGKRHDLVGLKELGDALGETHLAFGTTPAPQNGREDARVEKDQRRRAFL